MTFIRGHDMTHFLKKFGRDTDGAVTVDWVVLTAAIVTLALVIFAGIKVVVMERTAGITATIAATE
jgi:Flp pilus assembly pilin Flp